MNLRQVEAFRAVMMLGSVTQAASAMHVTQPAVSKLIAQMERSAGLRLFKRAKNKLEPTPEALLLFRTVEHAFVGLDQVVQAAEKIREFHVGHLRIASLPALAQRFLPRVMRRFAVDHPGVTFTLTTRTSANVEGWIASQQYDLGLVSNFSGSATVSAEPFADLDGVCVFPRGHKLAALELVRPADLAGLPFVSLAPENQTRREIDKIFERTKVPRQLVVETPYSSTVCGLVLERLGVAIVNPITAREFVDLGLVARRFRPRVQFHFLLVQPRYAAQSRLAMHFIKALCVARDNEIASTSWLMPRSRRK